MITANAPLKLSDAVVTMKYGQGHNINSGING